MVQLHWLSWELKTNHTSEAKCTEVIFKQCGYGSKCVSKHCCQQPALLGCVIAASTRGVERAISHHRVRAGTGEEMSYIGSVFACCLDALCMFHLLWKGSFSSSATVQAVSHQPHSVLLPFLQPAVVTLLLEKIPEFFFDVWVQTVFPLSWNVLPHFEQSPAV